MIASLQSSRRADYAIGETIFFRDRAGKITGLCADPMYPVKVRLDGEQGDTRPFWDQIVRLEDYIAARKTA